MTPPFYTRGHSVQKKNALFKGSLLAIAIGLVGTFEGYRTESYQDTGKIWTICYGETLGVKAGQTASKQQCDNMLIQSLLRHNKPFESLPHQLPDNVHLATLDWVYNVGTGNATRSTLWKYLRAGEWERACDQLPRWSRVAGKDCSIRSNNCYGVYQRRHVEQQICLGQITGDQAIHALGGDKYIPDGATLQ